MVVQSAFTIKTLLRSITSDNELLTILRDRTFKTNKIILEGSYLFHIYILYILSNNIPLKINGNTIRRCSRILVTGASNSVPTNYENKVEDELIKFVKHKYFNFNLNLNERDGRHEDFSNSYNGLMDPVDHACDDYFKNLREHIIRNFKPKKIFTS